ncbi:peptidyl-prolyl cis-trans isomerase, cyclophilin-type [Rhodotorula toruloides]|uniref:Peptidyl-prolyl cis-trans isomerase, cyclophilin-type n=1 Tax=Rhodotorula toruloides TaxID=5286 RepID=A0A511K7E0_RHOTO|nr:peptidyl-prolyl cis-trans isomerase, cyclophilin-type [Rhodotorula toruloides]
MSFVVTEPITEGLVVLHTSLGDILIELWRRECPKAVRNFVQLCLEGHYDGVPFHRIVPGFIAQTGGSDECIYDDGSFGIETNQRLKFNRRGLVAMAADPTTKSNMSQFFFTLDAAPELQNKHTLFGRVAGDSLFNLLKLQEVELEPGTDKPVFPPTIKRAEVRVDPFEDGPDPIRPRITAEERREQEKAKKEMMAERAREKKQGKRKGTKNKALLSFGADAEEPEDASLPKTKFKSAHDVLHDSRLSSQVIDDRGLSATLPPELMSGPPVSDREDKGKRRRAEDDSDRRRDEKRGRTEAETSGSARLNEARKLKEIAPKSEAERRKEEIVKVQAELKRMTGRAGSDDEETGKATKAKRNGPSLLQLEREKYLRGGAKATGKGKKRANDEDDVLNALEGFRSKLFQAAKTAPKDEAAEEDKPEKLYGIDLNDDELEEDTEGWMTHSLKFRKDATQDLHALDEYAVVDPLAKNSMTLDEMKNKANNRGARRYAGEEREERRGGGGAPTASGSGSRYEGGRDRDRGDRYGGGGRERGDRYSGRDERERSRPEVRGDWKQARVSTSDLA